MFDAALEITDGPVAIRWPRGTARQIDPAQVGTGLRARNLRDGPDACLIAAGSRVQAAVDAADQLRDEGIEVSVWDPRVLKPLDRDMLRHAAEHPLVVTIEDGTRVGGFGSTVNDALQRRGDPIVPRVIQLGTPDSYLPFGSADDLHSELGLDSPGLAASIRKALLRDAN